MRRSELFTLFVLFILLMAVANSVIVAGWLPNLGVTMWAAVFGLIAGVTLAFSSFPSWTAHLTSAIYGLFCVGVIGGTRPEIAILNDWRERIFLMVDKVAVWLREAMSNGSSRETLIFFLILSSLFWMLGYAAAWYSFRHASRRIWHVILPSGVTLFSNVYYYAGERSMTPYLAAYIVCAIILLALSHLAEKENGWLRERVRFNTSLRGGFVVTGLAIAMLALLFSWRVSVAGTSSTTRDFLGQFSQPYNEFLARWNRLFSTLQNPVARSVDSYPDNYTLSGARNLSDEPVFDVVAPVARYYWRARSRDFYDGTSWRSTVQIEQDVKAFDPSLPTTNYEARQKVLAEFNLYRGTDTVRAPSMPLQSSVASRAVLEPIDNGQADIIQLKLSAALLPGNRYSAFGSVSTARVSQLRNAGTNYPNEILQRYLELPNNVPERVKDLARKIVQDENTPFDRAVAIERFLRNNIAYDEKIEAPSQGVEASDYILFDIRRAYCDYYATSMIVMLRSLGIPARIAQGYAQGDPNLETPDADVATYRVLQKDSHAWVEVFFPRYGWIEFEPTAAQPPIARNEDQQQNAATPTAQPPTPTPQTQSEATPTPEPTDPVTQQPVAPPPPNLAELIRDLAEQLSQSWLRYLLIIPIVLGALWLAIRFVENVGLANLPAIDKAYAMLTRWANWLGIGKAREHTPFEQAAELSQRAPNAGQSIDTITQKYVARKYSPKPENDIDDLREISDVKSAWKATRGVLRRVWLVEKISSLVKPKRN